MATKCAHCGSVAHTRSSEYLTEITQIEYFACSNVACGHTFTALRAHHETLSPPAVPNPRVKLPQATRARLMAVQIALRKKADDSQQALPLDD
ncbi:Ogr/Delta-like zinc finger protein [Crenobacter luteus]|uniref:ogr/Delta-like zinc finger family protein n=1 Tax=Crenobacter luteus TaxID=1452487 RepID=UPI0010447380|nr:ogr/Delta-like zinc finger family protein [Crenobacter luteus]TCP13792.1 Ogr/Delta-like zinc finger protein [Crenobacter luteus]